MSIDISMYRQYAFYVDELTIKIVKLSSFLITAMMKLMLHEV